MAPKTILSSFQQKFLDILATDPYITSRFYFTGGTVLSEFYLQHRLSEDFDLFSEKEVYLPSVSSFLTKIAPKTSIIKMEHRPFLGLHSFMLHLKNGGKFKIDFNFYPYPRINIGKKYKNLNLDSLYDIAVNKVHTLFMKPRARDYVDLYFIFKKTEYAWRQLILDAKAKFDWHIDPLLLGSQIKKVEKLTDFPRMLLPFNQKDMVDFFLKQAKSLEGEIFK
ncbi:MAG: hypothetical protein UT84_C0021G0012 [Candidatus Curtissbacteria bacterium GW2011_GWA1_40_16]|uniref:Nucleotidyl transferase AbiEii/AbiGii toxin family protein n=1 Tax=Candidatus Curtissbacteria bacterium GW2011_GWA1_40_16 TaxID=1618405 RepID=A0A0G0RIN4_9BACT|nr:MAG: hypothetical protein UT84_C0021G0012 [Candidatus Curtissbacteria bacterium GW2011_GWA1_40_16]